MDFIIAQNLVAVLMRQHGCSSVPVLWSRSLRKFGTVLYYKGDTVPSRIREIKGQLVSLNTFMYDIVSVTFSRPLVEANTEPIFRNIVLHEIAHVLDIRKRGFTDHTESWYEIARSIGCNGDVNFDDGETVIPKGKRVWKYVATCKTCKREFFSNVLWKSSYKHCQRCLDKYPKDHSKSYIWQKPVQEPTKKKADTVAELSF